MEYVTLISLLAIAAGGMAAAVRHLQMLQQSSYFPSRYLKWLKTAWSLRTLWSIVAFGLAFLTVFFSYSPVYLVLVALVCLVRIPRAKSDYKHSIKKLVFTARVKRQYALCCLLCVAPGVLGWAFHLQWLIYIGMLLAYATPLTCLVAWTILQPLEKSISAWYVNDAKKMLRAHKGLRVIGITGSYGKTSTKYILGRILKEKYNVLITPESYNTPMGIVRTVRGSLRPETQIFVAEMGAKKKGDVEEICRIANPEMGIITSVGPQHLDTFGSIETVAATKFELADHCKKNNGPVFLNTDNELIARRAENYATVSYGFEGNPDYTLQNLNYTADGLCFDLVQGGQAIPLTTRLLGRHNALNIAAAAACAHRLGVSAEDIRFAVASLTPVEHRLQMKPFLNGSLLIDDAYNANPEGCLEAVQVLSRFAGYKKIIVTPGLVELGAREYDCNFALGAAAAKYCDEIILVGQKRAVPMQDAIKKTDFDPAHLFVVDRFADALAKLGHLCDKNTVVLFENDLPDNYAG